MSLADYINSLDDFAIFYDFQYGYDHIGACLTDSVLQAGLKYETVVEPRVHEVLAMEEARTTSGFKALLDREGTKKVLRWKDDAKPECLEELVGLLLDEGVETEWGLKAWLNLDNDHKLRAIKGIGPKTVDYIKMLVGIHTVAVDRHIRKFVEQAGYEVNSYKQVRDLVSQTANELGTDPSSLDHSIWVYMSGSAE